MSPRSPRRRRREPVRFEAVATVIFAVVVMTLCGVGLMRFYSQPAPGADVSPAALSPTPEPKHPVSLWIGDSYTAGVGAPSTSFAESCLTANALGWLCTRDAQSGTGFIADGHNMSPTYVPLPKRFAHTAATFVPDVVVLDAGRNDAVFPAGEVVKTARTYIAGLRAAFPKAKLALIAPYFMNTTKPLIPGLVRLYRAEAKKPNTYLIDPVRSGWIGADTAAMVISDHKHPTPEGHRYIADHLAAAIRGLHLGVATS